MIKKSDNQIVALALNNDKYFGELVDRYSAKLTRYIFRLMKADAQTAEDILQEVFIKIYRNLNDFDDSFSFSSWAYRITHNEVISYVRKNKVRPQTISIEDEEEGQDLLNILSEDNDFAEKYDQKKLQKQVQEAIAKLPEKYRSVLILKYLEDKSYAEIGDILKRSVNSVSVLINRAKQKLKKEIQKTNLKI